jgi:hypothetical protein
MQWATPQERRKLGQARRKQVGRLQHDELKPKARKTPALELLARSMQGRVPALVQLKYKLMAESPFGYFRGAVPVMAADLGLLPSTGIMCQLCGDAHVRNLGAFAAPDGRLVFDINDFDETIRGPFEWDLKRMAASLVVAGRAAGHKEASAREAVEKCIARYAAQMRAFARMPLIEVGRFQVHRLGQVAPIHDALLKAERATPQHTLEQLTERAAEKSEAGFHASRGGLVSHPFRKDREMDGAREVFQLAASAEEDGARKSSKFEAREISGRRFKEQKPTLTRVTGRQAEAVVAALGTYRQTLEPQRQHLLSFYRPVDVAFKVVGTGSVGLRDYCVYLEGNGPGDPLFLQVKEETASGYAHFLPDAQPPHHNGQRVAERARLPGPPTERPQGFHRDRRPGRRRPGGLRRSLRRAAGARPRTLWRPADSDRLYRQRRRFRPGSGQVRLALRRPDREGLEGTLPLRQGRQEAVERLHCNRNGASDARSSDGTLDKN